MAQEMVQRVPSCYVGEDCLQMMVPYKKEIIMLDKNEIIYSHTMGSHESINKYLEDDRRKQFPYSNIPTHFSKDGLFGRKAFTNQIMSFNEPYIRFVDGGLFESFAVKDGKEAFLINRIMAGDNPKSVTMTRKEVEDLFDETQVKNGKKYVFHIDLNASSDFIVLTSPSDLKPESEIWADLQEEILTGYKEFRKLLVDEANNGEVYTKSSNYLRSHPWLLKILDLGVKQIDSEDLTFEMTPLKGGNAIIITVVNGEFKVEVVSTQFTGIDRYVVDKLEIPVNKYTLEQFKHLSTEIITSPEPKIPLKLNPGITEKDIDQAQQLVKRFMQ